ncbi:MAG: hypothetical protein K6U03_04615 [Firmicutes bacterium]|nr:hypothetical protein [Bacillota bacterium]
MRIPGRRLPIFTNFAVFPLIDRSSVCIMPPIGAFLGALISLVLRHSRPRYHWWLGAGLGFGIWFASLAFGNLVRIIKADQTDPWSLFAHLLAMLAFGLLIVLASRIWPAYRQRIEE